MEPPRQTRNLTHNTTRARVVNAGQSCPERELNPHDLSVSKLRVCRVYQFHHPGTTVRLVELE